MTDQERNDFFALHYDEIEKEIEKRRRKWQLKAVVMLDFDDIKSIIINHIYQKLHLYDQSQPLLNWVNIVCSNQIRNLLRNNYYSAARPCVQNCWFNAGGDSCLYTPSKLQCSECPVYSKWEQNKKNAFNIKIALPSENHLVEIFDLANTHYDISDKVEQFHILIKKYLKPFEYRIYECLYINGMTEVATARKLGYKSKEQFKYRGYASIAKAKKVILLAARKIIENEEIDLI